jgi:hypothetical protein
MPAVGHAVEVELRNLGIVAIGESAEHIAHWLFPVLEIAARGAPTASSAYSHEA